MNSTTEMTQIITIAIVDDHQMLIETLRTVIGNEPDIQIVGEADNCSSCLELVRQVRPIVLLLDVSLPDGDGLSLVPKINRLSPETNILILTSLSDEATLMKAVDLGVSGFVGKNQHLKELITAIRQAANGEIAIPASLLLGLLSRKIRPHNQPSANQIHEALTSREVEVLNCLAQGFSGPDMAAKLNISPLTVQTHIRNIIMKLGVHSRLEAVTYALQWGLIEPPL